MNCNGCKYLTKFGCNTCTICERHELLKNLSEYLQKTAIDRFKKDNK